MRDRRKQLKANMKGKANQRQRAEILRMANAELLGMYVSNEDDSSMDVDMAGWSLPGTGTTSWCIVYFVQMGQTIESHHEGFVRRCKLERNCW